MSSIEFRDRTLIPLWTKVQEGKRLSLSEGLSLYRSDDIISLGKMADSVKDRLNGDAVYFAVNQKIEPSNICALSCRFCSFSTKKGKPGAYDLDIETIVGRISPQVREVHITGALNPFRDWEYYCEMVRRIRERAPDAVIKAFTAIEIDFFSKKFSMPMKTILTQLRDAGLAALPGGGAEVFSGRVRRLLCYRKIGAQRWLSIHSMAHRLGIQTNATLLYGHIESLEERLMHLAMLRELQDKTGGFLAFVPLAFQPGTTGIKPAHEFTSAIDDLKTLAVSRLMLDNFPHIKAYWVMLTEGVATAALHFGADDLDGTVGGEQIAHSAGALSPVMLEKERIIELIRAAGKIPVERDGFYRALDVHGDHVIGKIPYLNSTPFYNYFEKGRFNMLPIVPRWMGVLSRRGKISAGLYSLMDYLRQEEDLELLRYCIAVRGDVRSVMLFSRHRWQDLAGKRIGITDDTATSVQLLRLLLTMKYGITTELERMRHDDRSGNRHAAILLIGDEALKYAKRGISGHTYVFDLAAEWSTWQGLPFVFAVWARKRTMDVEAKKSLSRAIGRALEKEERSPSPFGLCLGRRIGLSPSETSRYLEAFIFRLGTQERRAIRLFRKLIEKIDRSGPWTPPVFCRPSTGQEADE